MKKATVLTMGTVLAAALLAGQAMAEEGAYKVGIVQFVDQ